MFQRQREAALALPHFIFLGVGGNLHGEPYKFCADVKNTGSPVSNVEISMDVDLKNISPASVSHWDTGEINKMQWEFKNSTFPNEATMSINFTDRLNNHNVKQYKIIKNQNPEGRKAEVLPIEANQALESDGNYSGAVR